MSNLLSLFILFLERIRFREEMITRIKKEELIRYKLYMLQLENIFNIPVKYAIMD